ncbi:MAG: FxLYD domain-containing protein [Thermodesulfobacteriota bacterium]|nr:FxLYD domain-containing protein [Thermodesulfobacteriota bacterium]
MKRLLIVLAVSLSFLSASFAGENALEFVESNSHIGENKENIRIDGIVKNVSKGNLLRVKITIDFLDKEGNLIKSESVSTSPAKILSGQEASYEITTKYDSRIARYKKSAQWRKLY